MFCWHLGDDYQCDIPTFFCKTQYISGILQHDGKILDDFSRKIAKHSNAFIDSHDENAAVDWIFTDLTISGDENLFDQSLVATRNCRLFENLVMVMRIMTSNSLKKYLFQNYDMAIQRINYITLDTY